MALHNQNFQMVAGETRSIYVTVTDSDTVALVDFSGATITWVLEFGTTNYLTKTVGAGITVTGLGAIKISLSASDTTSLVGNYIHECRATLADTRIATLFNGTVFIQSSII